MTLVHSHSQPAVNRLQAELQRLYLLEDALVTPADRTRTLVLQVTGPGAWGEIARVWQGVQADLQLPPPAIAVNGRDGYQLWFSLEEPVTTQQAFAWLDALRAHYLPNVAPARIALTPSKDGSPQQGTDIPPHECGPERWSAFIAADLAPLFAQEPWLDLTPSAEAQAELLARLRPIQQAEWREAVDRWSAPVASNEAPTSGSQPRPARTGLAAQEDPRRFLLDVMNDPAVDLRLRIEAAKALLGAP